MPAPPKQKFVLHIGDNENDRYLVKRTIKSVHPSLMIRYAESGEDAIAFLRQAKLFNDLPCLIIMDIELTIDGQNGYHELRKDPLLLTIPVVVLFTTADDKEIRKWSRSRIVFVPRPAKYRDFARYVEKALAYCV